MSVPVVVLNRDQRLDKLSLEYIVNGGQGSLQDLARDAKVDGLALDYNHSFATSGIVPPGRQGPQSPRRKRRKLVNSFVPDVSLQATTLGRSTLTLSDASKQEGSESPSILNSRSVRSSAVASKQDDRVQIATSDRGSCHIRQTMADCPGQDGCELTTLSNGHSSNTSEQEEISKEDFMALLCLAPTHVAARIRKCTLHRASKYLHIKTRNLWAKLCSERNDHCYVPDPETAQRPSCVLLERNEIIDSLALRSVPQSIHLKSLGKSAIHRKHLCTRKPRSLNVVPDIDPGLDRLTLKPPSAICTSSTSKSPETIAVLSDPVVASVVSLPADPEANDAFERTGCRCLSVKINRDSSLDMLALQTSNSVCESVSQNSLGVSSSERNTISHVSEKAGLKHLSINIERDLFIDQLALRNSSISVADSCSDCNNTTVPYHHPTSVTPSEFITSSSSLTNGRGEGMENSFEHNCKTKLGLLPNFKVQNDCNVPDVRKAVIKLRRISTGEWSVIQPHDELNRNAHDSLPSSAVRAGLESSGFQSSAPDSTDSKNTTVEFTRNPCTRISRLSNSSKYEGGLSHETLSHDIQSSANHSGSPTFAYHQHSAKMSLEETCKTVNWASCSKSSRAKSVPSEEPPQELHHNENKNPRKVIPPVKTVDMHGKYSSNATVVESRGLRKKSQRVLENNPPKRPHSKSDAACFRYPDRLSRTPPWKSVCLRS